MPLRVIVIGAGDVGRFISEHLAGESKDVVVIDTDERRIREVADSLDVETIVGSGSNPAVLRRAGIERAEMVIAVTDSDEVNIIATAVAGAFSKSSIKIARIREQEYHRDPELLEKAGIHVDLVINPELAAADRILNLLRVAPARDLIEFIDGRIQLVGLHVGAQSPVVGRKLRDLPQLHPTRRVLVAMIERGDRVLVPRGDTVIHEGDQLYTVAEKGKVPMVMGALGGAREPVRSVFISGGGPMAFYLAQELERGGISVKIAEADEARCEHLSDHLQRTVVLHGAATDQRLLEQEHAGGMDAFVALTPSDEANILSALLARRLGTRTAIVATNKLDYVPLISAVGVDVVVSPRQAAVSSVLRFVRQGRVLSATSFLNERAEAIDFIALETSDMVGKPLHKLPLPRDAIVGAIMRDGETIIPTGNDIIQPQDRVIVFCHASAVPKVEKALTVKLTFF